MRWVLGEGEAYLMFMLMVDMDEGGVSGAEWRCGLGMGVLCGISQSG